MTQESTIHDPHVGFCPRARGAGGQRIAGEVPFHEIGIARDQRVERRGGRSPRLSNFPVDNNTSQASSGPQRFQCRPETAARCLFRGNGPCNAEQVPGPARLKSHHRLRRDAPCARSGPGPCVPGSGVDGSPRRYAPGTSVIDCRACRKTDLDAVGLQRLDRFGRKEARASTSSVLRCTFRLRGRVPDWTALHGDDRLPTVAPYWSSPVRPSAYLALVRFRIASNEKADRWWHSSTMTWP